MILEIKVVQCFMLQDVAFNCLQLVQAEFSYALFRLIKKKENTTQNYNPLNEKKKFYYHSGSLR